MKALLDTHVLVWAIMDDPRLSALAREVITDTGNELFLSVASVWEMIIKAQRGRLRLPGDPAAFILEHLGLLGIESLPVELSHVLRLLHLPAHHRDPFDRMLVAQSQMEGLPILTSDPLIARYSVEVIW